MNWKQAFTLGLLAPGVWEGVAEATMYSYNGVVLPGLPEVDSDAEMYAHIYIGWDSDSGKYRAYAVSEKVYFDTEANYACNSSGKNYFTAKHTDTDGDSAWAVTTASGVQDWSNGGFLAGSSIYPPIWANFDIYDLGGNLYLAASDPVPVYE